MKADFSFPIVLSTEGVSGESCRLAESSGLFPLVSFAVSRGTALPNWICYSEIQRAAVGLEEARQSDCLAFVP